MSTGDEELLSIEPLELKFPFELNKQIPCSLQLSNKTDSYVAFKAQREAPPDMQCNDKFLFQSVRTFDGASWEDINAEMFNVEAGHGVEECKLRVVYDSAENLLNLNRSEMSTDELFTIEPLELKFPFEHEKMISCSLQLTSKTDSYVAFKVKTTNPDKYYVRPNIGIVLPRSTCDVIVTMLAQMEVPPDMQCKDKFLFQSVRTFDGASWKDINAEMFKQEEGHVVEECKLRVVYDLPPQPITPTREESSQVGRKRKAQWNLGRNDDE
ncbi:hypothetical protein PIB30_001397 [Stylosanthes scabra]|uniref:MSP domain-containing protein n=1 Tax=Stylosanthes scabra TaxID=79078 RepID=A0ABU6YZW1_9FABA|nr:hypothetical protein [Stylosanthes scabra]